ncbi:MAG: hypothetical protein ABIG84_02235 [archaeon]
MAEGNIIVDGIIGALGVVYDATIGALIRLFVDILEKVLFWGVPEVPPPDVQAQWSMTLCVLALCAIIYAGFYILFKERGEVKFNYRYLFLGFLLMKTGLFIFRDVLMVTTAAVTVMLSTFDNPVSALFHLLAGGSIALLIGSLPIILFIIGMAIQVFIGLIGGYLLCIAGIYYMIPMVSFKEKGDFIIKILVADLGLAIINTGLLMMTLFASSGMGSDIISRFIIALGYICTQVIVMYMVFSSVLDSPKVKADVIEVFVIPNTKNMGSLMKRIRTWRR